MSAEDNRTWQPVAWFEIYVTNMDWAKAFSGNVVHRDSTPSPMSGGDMEICFFAAERGAEGAAGGLIRHPMRSPNAEGTLVYFSVDECAAATDCPVAHGSDVVVCKQSIGEIGFIAIITDSEGSSIGLHSWR